MAFAVDIDTYAHTGLRAGRCSAGQRGVNVVENKSLQRVVKLLDPCVSLCRLPWDRAEAGRPRHRAGDLDRKEG